MTYFQPKPHISVVTYTTVSPAVNFSINFSFSAIFWKVMSRRSPILCYIEVAEHYNVSIINKQFQVESSRGTINFQQTNNVIAQLFEPSIEVS
jgi:hypothetical protein